MIVYTCPRCGNDLQEIALTSNPPQYQKFCSRCGWSHTTVDEIYRIPYQLEATSALNYVPEACKKCSNHPSNGGSGICHCTLGVTTTTC